MFQKIDSMNLFYYSGNYISNIELNQYDIIQRNIFLIFKFDLLLKVSFWSKTVITFYLVILKPVSHTNGSGCSNGH